MIEKIQIYGIIFVYADMAELVDALSSDGSAYGMRVRISLSAPLRTYRFDTMKIEQIFKYQAFFLCNFIDFDQYGA